MLCFSLWCLSPSAVKRRAPQATSLQKVRSSQHLPRYSEMMSKFTSWETEDAKDGGDLQHPRIPRDVHNQVLSHCLLHENIGWWHDFCSGHEPKALPLFMAAAAIGICDKKWTVEYKIPASFWSSINPLCHFFPQRTCQSHGLSALSTRSKGFLANTPGRSCPLPKTKAIMKNRAVFSNPPAPACARNSFPQCMNTRCSPLLTRENILGINTMTTSTHLHFTWLLDSRFKWGWKCLWFLRLPDWEEMQVLLISSVTFAILETSLSFYHWNQLKCFFQKSEI